MGGTTFASTELTYRLFASQTFGFDFALWGLNAFGFHLTNLIAHLGTMLSVWWLLALLGLRVWSSSILKLEFPGRGIGVAVASSQTLRSDDATALRLACARTASDGAELTITS